MLNNIEIEKLKKLYLCKKNRYVLIILIVPASEAAVEGLFAHLGTVYNKKTCNMEPDTTNAQLTNRMNRISEDVNTVTATVSRRNRYATLADVLRSLDIEK